MKYITATISAGSKLVCNLDYYTNAEGKTDFYPLVQNSILYYRFRVITNNLSNEWKDILQAENDRWVVFKNTSLPYPIQTAALPLEAVNDRGMVYLQADIPSYVLSAPGYLSITVVFTYNGKTMVTLSQDESDADPLRILPANNNLDMAILANMSVEDKTLYHKLIGLLAGGRQGQILMKDANAGNLSYKWADGSALTSSTYYAGTVRQIEDNSENYIIATIADTARGKITSLPENEDEVVLVNSAIPESSTQLIGSKEYIVTGWDVWANGQFLVSSPFSFGTLNLSTQDYLFSNGKEWLQLPAIDRSIVEQIVADSYVPWNYGSNAGDTKKTLNMVDISGNAGSADKVNHSIDIAGAKFDGHEDIVVSSIKGEWLDDGSVKASKLNADVSNVYIPWNYSGGSQEAVNIDIAGNAGSANKVNNKLTIFEQTFDGSQPVVISAQTLATLLDAYAGAYIDTPNLRDLSVASGKIGNGAVISDKLASGAVVTNALADKAVTYAKLDGDGMRSRLLRIGTGNRAPTSSDASSYDLWVQWV